MIGGAVLSGCGLYRYRLWREIPASNWKPGKVQDIVFLMLNPSTADGSADDATIRRCLGFARRENAARIEVVNLFAFRATNPSNLPASFHRAVGPENDAAIRFVISRADLVICAWGAFRHPHMDERTSQVAAILDAERVDRTARRPLSLTCLGKTASGHPRHPVRLAGDTPLVPWSL